MHVQSYQRAYAAELYWQIRRGQHFILIDVRKQIEFAVQRISGSFNVPIDKLDASRFDTVCLHDLVLDSATINLFHSFQKINQLYYSEKKI